MPSNNDDQKKQAVVAFAAGAIMGAATTVLFIHGAPPGTVRPVTNLKRYVRSPDFVPHFMFATFFWVGVTIREQQVRRKAFKERQDHGRS